MNGIWQDIAVTAAAVAAVAWLIRQRIRARRRGCATCSLAEVMARDPAAGGESESGGPRPAGPRTTPVR
jgi:hypothetical protein